MQSPLWVASPIAEIGVGISPYTFMETDREIFPTVILLLPPIQEVVRYKQKYVQEIPINRFVKLSWFNS